MKESKDQGKDKIQVVSTPRRVSIAITGRCNLRCQYCFYADEMVAKDDLPTKDWLAFFNTLGDLGVMEVTLTGGEAFTRSDLFELIDRLIANRMRYCILTNGTLVTDDLIEKLKTGKRRIRLNYLQVSIDGSCAEVHNRSRPNSFEHALRGVKLLKEAGIPVIVRTTINKHNLDDLENTAHLLLEDVGLASFGTNEAFPMGAGCQNQGQVSLTSLEKLQAMKTIESLLEKYPGRITGVAGPLAKLKMYAEMERARETGVKTTRWGMGYLTACGCTFSALDVMHNGDIVPCHILPKVILGNIKQDSFKEIWQKHPILKTMRSRQAIPMEIVPGCEDCQWNSYCNGSCPGLAYELTGDFNRANPEDCYRKFLLETKGEYALRS
jgi:SynChlorMet cassette radical SAM/SPASM protein ScmE